MGVTISAPHNHPYLGLQCNRYKVYNYVGFETVLSVFWNLHPKSPLLSPLFYIRAKINTCISSKPEWSWDAWECSVRFLLLSKVAQGGEDEHSHGQEKHEESKLLVTVLQGEGDGLKSGGVTSQFEDSHDSHDPKYLWGSSVKMVSYI